MPIFHLDPRYSDTWVVLDRGLRVVDCGQHLEALRRKHGADTRRTFCFVCGPERKTEAALRTPWSLRALLGYAPVALELAHNRT
jgi:hypothetical protein